MKTAIIGLGLIGRAWAISFARAGHEVRLWDADPAAAGPALAFIAGAVPELAAHGLLNGQATGDVMARLHVAVSLSEALAGAEHVQENAPERVEVKIALYEELDRLAPADAILASSTSAILPSKFTE